MNASKKDMPKSLEELQDYRLYTIKVAVELFGLTRGRAYDLAQKGTLRRAPKEIAGTSVLFTGAELKRFARFMAEGSTETEPAAQAN